MSSPDSALVISLIRGPLFGTFIGLILYGFTCMQAFFYFRTYDRDTRRLKFTVASIVVLETLHAVMTMYVMDDYLVAHYANLPVLETPNWSSTLMFILGLLIDFCVYCYFTWRIWQSSRNAYIVVLMIMLSTSRTAIGISLSIHSITKLSWISYVDSFKILTIISNTLFIIGDILSASAMAYYLHKLKSWVYDIPPGRPRRIHLILNYLLVFAVATGALTSLMDIIALILTLSEPQSLAFESIVIIQTRLYANSLLASLNIRNAASRAYNDALSIQVEHPVSTLRFARPSDLSGEAGALEHDK